jgi:hypothetical protein
MNLKREVADLARRTMPPGPSPMDFLEIGVCDVDGGVFGPAELKQIIIVGNRWRCGDTVNRLDDETPEQFRQRARDRRQELGL